MQEVEKLFFNIYIMNYYEHYICIHMGVLPACLSVYCMGTMPIEARRGPP